jgi:creatinine amidohydrolase
MRPWKLSDVNLKYVKENPYQVAVLPLGATEPHNLHLPYGTDTIQSEAICDRICEQAHALGAKVALLPAIPFGVDTNLMEFPMPISINPSTLDLLISDIVDSLEYHGIRKIVIVNGHGGNSLKHTLRELYGKTSAFVCLVNWYEVAHDLYPQLFKEVGDHAGAMETSMMQYLCPELVDLSLADDGATRTARFEALNQGWVQVTRPFHLVTTNCGVGNPQEASPDKAEQVVNRIVERISRFLKELSDAEMDDLFPY